MPRLQADMDTLQRVRVVLADAMERGLDAAEALDRAGLLTYEALRVRARVQTIGDIATAVEVITPDQVARELSQRQATSAGEMKRQIAEYLRSASQAVVR